MMLKKSAFYTTIAIVLIVLCAIPAINLPTVEGAGSKKTFAFIGALPNPVGVGQEVLLHLGISDPTAWPQSGWTGITVIVTRPDGTNETLGPFSTDTTGGTGTIYIPATAGNYTLQTFFPQQTNTVAASGYPVGTVFAASSSTPLKLVVQEDPIPYYPSGALPTEYWARPINAQLREWAAVSGNWLSPSSLFGPAIWPAWIAYGNADAPDSPHILWTKPIGDTMGGLIGGEYGGDSYGTGDAYEGKWAGSIIINGILYYNKFESGQPHQQVVAVDIHTGKELWTKDFNNSRIAFGQVLDFKSFNYMGAFSYLWTTVGTTWHAWEPLTGDWRYSMTNVPSGTSIYGPNGEICRYTYDLAHGWMTFWNSTKVIFGNGADADLGSWGSKVRGVTYDASRGIEWNKTLPMNLPGSVRVSFLHEMAMGSLNTVEEIKIWGISLKPGQEGTLIFNKSWKTPSEWTEGNVSFAGMSGGWTAYSIEDKVAVLSIKETRSHYAFSLENGNFMWGPTPSQIYLDMYFGDGKLIADGKFYSANVGGIVYCYDVKTGKLLWTYAADDPYTEFQFGNNWWLEPMFLADGKLYLGHAEHSANNPRPRGAPFICLNATTGDVVWRVNGLLRTSHWGGLAIIGDSIMVMQNTYEQQIYAVGKGPSAITVEAPLTAVKTTESLVIRGTVTDVSPGVNSDALTARFPNGVPVVSDESMGDWMKYVYQQFERPTNATGVPVELTAIDPNGNYRIIGTTTTDSRGFFSLQWNPDVSGKYTVIATFAGTGGYYGSSAETAFAVDDPAATASPQPTQAPSMADLYFMPGIIGVIVAVIVVGAVLALLLLRKRP